MTCFPRIFLGLVGPSANSSNCAPRKTRRLPYFWYSWLEACCLAKKILIILWSLVLKSTRHASVFLKLVRSHLDRGFGKSGERPTRLERSPYPLQHRALHRHTIILSYHYLDVGPREADPPNERVARRERSARTSAIPSGLCRFSRLLSARPLIMFIGYSSLPSADEANRSCPSNVFP